MIRIPFAVALGLFLVSCGGESRTETGVSPTAAAPATTSSTPAAAPAPPALGEAEKLVAELYESHAAEQSPFFQTTNRALVDRYFDKELADFIWNDAVQSQGEVGALEFDPLYASQDTEITNLAVQPGQPEGANARVLVAFLNHGTKEQITYTLAPAAGNWKIADIRYGDGTTLRGVFRSYAALPESSTTSAAPD